MRTFTFAVGLAVAVSTPLRSSATPSAPASLPLSLVADLPLPGGASRFDYQWLDADQRRLYMAHLGDGSLLVFDLEGQRVIHEVPHLPSVHGVVLAPDLHLVLTTATASKSLALIDDSSLEVKARVPAGEYPNGLAYDPDSGRAFISNNSGPGIAVVDVKTARSLPSIDIGGGAGNTQYDTESRHVLAAVHGLPVLVDIDPMKSAISGRIKLRDVSSCHGLLVASKQRLAFAACHGATPRLVVVDLRERRQTATLPLPAGIDVLAFDPSLLRLYGASETGTVVVFDVDAARGVTERGRGFVGPNAHTVAVDPVSHRVYFPLADVRGHPVLRVMNP